VWKLVGLHLFLKNIPNEPEGVLPVIVLYDALQPRPDPNLIRTGLPSVFAWASAASDLLVPVEVEDLVLCDCGAVLWGAVVGHVVPVVVAAIFF